jgi:hypothetical protein
MSLLDERIDRRRSMGWKNGHVVGPFGRSFVWENKQFDLLKGQIGDRVKDFTSYSEFLTKIKVWYFGMISTSYAP